MSLLPSRNIVCDDELTVDLKAQSVDLDGDCDNYTQGCSFSPDGSCLLTCTASDNLLRIYNTPSCDPKQSCEEILPLQAAVTADPGESVRSYVWYPQMNSYHPISCMFLCASRDQPIHLYDAYTSSTIRATYRPYNALDEMEAPSVVCFSPDGRKIFAGGFQTDRTIHVFDTSIPGRDSDILRLGKTRRSGDGQKGLISAIAFPPNFEGVFGTNNIFAVGTYSPASIYIYDDRKPSGANPAGTVLHGGLCVVGHGRSFVRKKRRFADITAAASPENTALSFNSTLDEVEHGTNAGHDVRLIDTTSFNDDMFHKAKIQWYQSRTRGGVTQLTWSDPAVSDFTLYSASRRSDSVLAWDLRMLTGSTSRPVQGVHSFPRNGDTNQKLEFALSHNSCNKITNSIFIPSIEKCVHVYDTKTGKLRYTIDGFDDVVNGVSMFGSHDTGSDFVAISVGTRHILDDSFDSDDEHGVNVNGTDQANKQSGGLYLYEIVQASSRDPNYDDCDKM